MGALGCLLPWASWGVVVACGLLGFWGLAGGGGLGALLQWDFSTVGVCLGSGPGVCFRGPVGLLIIVALWAVGGCGCLGVPAWVSPFGGGPCHIHSLI